MEKNHSQHLVTADCPGPRTEIVLELSLPLLSGRAREMRDLATFSLSTQPGRQILSSLSTFSLSSLSSQVSTLLPVSVCVRVNEVSCF